MTVPFDKSKPNIARIYDYWLGGKDNFKADRTAAEAVRAVFPDVAVHALDNKKFLTRAVGYVAGCGVRQFLDIGSGLPTSPAPVGGQPPPWLATHEAAEAVVADPMVAYIDYDQVAVLHSETLLASGRRRVVATVADMREPAAILGNDKILRAGFDLSAPACVILACVLHFVDAEEARGLVAQFAAALAPGSYLIISVGFAKGEEGPRFARSYNAQNGSRIYSHSWEQITAFFDGLELVPPGIADAAVWRAEWPEGTRAERSRMIAAGVARRN